MAERRMADIVGEAQRLGEILVEPQRARHRAADLRDLQAVGQADAEMIAVGRDEHLRLVAEPAEGDRVDDAIAIALERVARPRVWRRDPRREGGRARRRDRRRRRRASRRLRRGLA